MMISPHSDSVIDVEAFERQRLEIERLRDVNALLNSAYAEQQKINVQLTARIEELARIIHDAL